MTQPVNSQAPNRIRPPPPPNTHDPNAPCLERPHVRIHLRVKRFHVLQHVDALELLRLRQQLLGALQLCLGGGSW